MNVTFKKMLAGVFLTPLLAACGNQSSQSELKEFSTSSSFGSRGGLKAKELVLTFDDGPGPYTADIARYLHSEGISATFFVLASKAKSSPKTMKLLRDLGHVVANHTNTHSSMPGLTGSKRIWEVRSTDKAIKPYTIDGINIFRAPYGAWSSSVARDLNGQSDLRKYVGPIFWDIGGGQYSSNYGYDADWACQNRGTPARTCADRYFKETMRRKGGIVLFHDIHPVAAKMVKILVPRWKNAGFTFKRIDQVPKIRTALKQTSTYRPGSGSGTTQCFEPNVGIFRNHGKVMSLSFAGNKGNASVDANSPRKDGKPYKLYMNLSNNFQGNIAFSASNAGKSLSGFGYNLNQYPNTKASLNLTWKCNQYEGSVSLAGRTQKVILNL